MKQVRLFTWPHCPFCINAKRLLDDKNVTYTDTDIYGNDTMKEELTRKTGQTTVPFIFIDNQFIGGYTELAELDYNGELDTLLQD